MAKHAKPDMTEYPLPSARMATIMDLTVEQMRDMLLTLALQEPGTFDAVRFAAL